MGLPPRDVIAQDLPGRGSFTGAGGSHTPASPRRSFLSGDTSCTLGYSFLLSQKGLSPL